MSGVDIQAIQDAYACLCHVRRGIFDTSTLLYIEKIGLLNDLALHIEVFVPPQVIEELGFAYPHWHVFHSLPCAADRKTPLCADDAVLAAAEQQGISLFSEDKKLLLKAQQKGIAYYNAIMLLILLLAQKRIDLPLFFLYRHRLLHIARYSPKVLDFANQVFLHGV